MLTIRHGYRRPIGFCVGIVVLLAALLAVPASPAAAASAWTPVTAPLSGVNPAPGADPKANIGGEGSQLPVSCPAVDSCVAVGNYTDGAGNLQPLIETLSAGTWSARTAPTTGLDPAPAPGVKLGSVQCPSVGSCVAVGSYRDSNGGFYGLIETLANGTWSSQTAPGGQMFVGDLACAAVGSCVIVGEDSGATGGATSNGRILTLTNGTWTSQNAPTSGLNPPAGAGSNVQLQWVTCAAVGSCVAVGYYQDSSSSTPNFNGILETLSNGTWSAQTAPLSGTAPAAASNPQSGLGHVTCPAAGSCVAVGSYSDTSGKSHGLIETLSGGTWTAQTAPTAGFNPAPADVSMARTSCASVASCVAVGWYFDTAGHIQGFIETLSNGTWTASTIPVTGLSPAAAADPQLFPLDVGCPTIDSCTLIGVYQDAAGNKANQGLIGTLANGAWSFETAPKAGLDPAAANNPGVFLGGLSCRTADVCVIGGGYTDSAGHRQPLFETKGLATSTPPPAGRSGYWLVGSDGGVFTFGDAGYFGSTGGMTLNRPIVAVAPTPDRGGYWLIASDGGVFSFGDATYHGSTGAMRLNQPIVGGASTPDGRGYWLVAADGGVFAFGDAGYFGSMGGRTLSHPIVGMTATASGSGYHLVGADGGIFSFGDATFYGSTGGRTLTKPVVGMAATATGSGYWLVASDGGVFCFGDAGYSGSTGGMALNKPVVGLAPTRAGQGYWLAASDGGVFSFGDAAFNGSLSGRTLIRPIVALAST